MAQTYSLRVQEIFFVFVVVWCSIGEATNLTVAPAHSSTTCPGVNMTFTCSSGGAAVASVRWRLTRNGADVIPQIAIIQQSGGCSQRTSSFGAEHIITVTLCTSFSTLTVTASNQLDGIYVECLLIVPGISSNVQILQIQIAQPPSISSDLRITNVYNGSYSATAQLRLPTGESPNTNSGVDDTIYTINITFAPEETWTSTVAQSTGSKLITLSYNTNYSLDVMATNCAGRSELYTIRDIFIANCSAPVVSRGVIVEPYNSTVEGTVVYFHCDNRIVWADETPKRMAAVCQSDGQWNTKVSEFRCEEGKGVVGGQTLQRLLDNKELLFQCEKGSGKFLAVCTEEYKNLTIDCHSIDIATNGSETGLIYHRVEFLVSFLVFSFILGMICCGCMLLPLHILIQKKCDKKRSKQPDINLSENMAYETITFPNPIFTNVQK